MNSSVPPRFMKAPLLALAGLVLSIDFVSAQTAAPNEVPESQEKLEARSYALAGFLPEFYEHDTSVDDPFASGEGTKTLQRYEDGVVSYLRANGLRAKEIDFFKEQNALILKGSSEELEIAEDLLMRMFGPDLQLKALDQAEKILGEKRLFEGDRLDQIGILDQVTMRAFHGEVKKLEEELAILPEGHAKRAEVLQRLNVARKYRDAAVQLCREALKQQRELVERWRKEAGEPTAPEAGR